MRRIAIAAAVALVPAAACAGGAPTGPTGSSTLGGAPTSSARDTGEVGEVVAAIEQLGRERFPDRYAGVELAEGRVVVYRKPAPELDAAVRALPQEPGVEVRDAPYSATELQALQERVQGDVDYWERRGITVRTVGARHDGTAVEVGTAQVERAERELPGRYAGLPPIVVLPAGPVVPASAP